jgi:hypothetical protein
VRLLDLVLVKMASETLGGVPYLDLFGIVHVIIGIIVWFDVQCSECRLIIVSAKNISTKDQMYKPCCDEDILEVP